MDNRLTVNYQEKPCYDIVFTTDFSGLSSEVESLGFKGRKIAIITDSNVGKIYGEEVKTSLESISDTIVIYEIPAGEENKQLDEIKKIYEFLTTKADASHNCMVGFEVEKTLSENGTVSRGICKAKDGMLTDIVEHLQIGMEADGTVTDTLPDGSKEIIPADAPVSMNLWGFGVEYMKVLEAGFKKALERIMVENPMKGEYLIPTTTDELIKEGKATVKVLESPDKWYGVTYKEDKPDVVAKFAALKDEGVYPRNLW
jgi:hypothetical protein